MQTISYFRLKSFLIHVSPSFYIPYRLVFQTSKGVCDRQCDFINKFCLLSVLMYTKWQYQSTVGVYRIAQTLEKPRRIYLEDSTVYEKLIFVRAIHGL